MTQDQPETTGILPNDCIFPIAALLPLLNHARHSPAHRATYSSGPAVPGLFFVHDQGVYLMSNGVPGLMRPDNPTHHQVVYAAGMSPNDDDWWETCRRAVGGDDFAELIPLEGILPAVVDGATTLIIRALPEALTIMAD
jgi:hypothetical protein